MKEYTLLNWDSEFFGFPVGGIIPKILDANRLEAVLVDLRRDKVPLVYWVSDGNSIESKAAGNSLGGFLVARKTTYILDLETLDKDALGGLSQVQEYREGIASEELEELAIQSGEYSRFKVDPRITTERFEELYRIWIRKSVAKTMGDAVMVVYDDNEKVAGMVTLGQKNDRGDIGLIAVDASCRGKGYGRLLVSAALQFFLSKGFKYSQVVTQGDNAPACKLYEAVGYKVGMCENVFHFWLD